ncbi:MAG: glycerol 3-phosphate dehydrogenase [Amoebophilaceae bacterium]|nr:glycerol 3-phosphate dehydrogenase [Amoebophilaceae bacterium]
MDWKKTLHSKPIAVLGAGNFGTAIAKLIAPQVDQLFLYTNKADVALESQLNRTSAGQTLPANVEVTHDLVSLIKYCPIIFPIIPASRFRSLMQEMAPYLTEEHLLIHGTKGLDITDCEDKPSLTRAYIATMSEVIRHETKVNQIGCLAGPNLAHDLHKKHPAATVVASYSKQVLAIGQQLLTNSWFRAYPSSHLLSVEFCSVLKNIFAIGAGLLRGMEYGDNTYAFFLSASLAEMHHILETMHLHTNVLLGPAGIGDLIATCNSSSSRNYTIGYRLAKGELLNHILATLQGVSEGVQTVKTIHEVMKSHHQRAPITTLIYRILFEQLSPKAGLRCLMRYPIVQ